ncbi:NACHT, LRR and PYD domains-containing protein 3-like [Hydractinia symbiolongicarpus]|uniref:NACHT, LRR and PYD domains-containing protein 3-like n=1 Tax=Hydractinia symbiolongicarpus TaxID=13093 RepID=UPI00254E0E65|nr:NACHT, LRR and PYD domains-containing protein 3-like [Hydractinia symbiolongicarpus]
MAAASQAGGSTPQDVINKNEYQVKLVALINECCDYLLDMLHDPGRGDMPKDKVKLYQALKPFEKKLQKHNLDIALPGNGETDSKSFDITTLCDILINCCPKIKKPKGGWKIKAPKETDLSDGAEIIRIRNARNSVMQAKALSEAKYVELWDAIQAILHRNGYDIKKITDLKTLSLKEYCLKNELFQIKLQKAEQDIIKDDVKQNKEEIRALKEDFETSKKSKEFTKLASLDALKFVSKMIGSDWKELARRLKIKLNVTVDINDEIKRKRHSEDESSETSNKKQKLGEDKVAHKNEEKCPNEVNMNKCFDNIRSEIPWDELKNELKLLGRQDIVNTITSTTCCTRGLKECSISLKQQYKKELSDWKMASAFKTECGRKYTIKDRSNAYVELVVGSWSETFASDQEHFKKNISSHKEKIDIKNIVQQGDEAILIRGIAGIGKTSFVENFVLQWANENILTDIDFVFKFTCRELNAVGNISSWEELVKRFFPNIGYFDGLFKNLIENNARVLIIIDGIDEFRYLNDLTKYSEGKFAQDFVSLIHDAIVQKIPLLSKGKVIVCGRPQACDVIKNILQEKNSQLKLIEVSGFSEDNVDTYIRKFFLCNEEKINYLKTALNEIENLKSMAYIPIYLYIICTVFNSEQKLEELNTITKLNIAACLVFLMDHMTEFKGKNCALIKLSESEHVLQMIKSTSEFAFKSLEQQRILFTQKEFENVDKDCLKTIEESGIIEKVEGDDDGDFYQFKHLVLQEFFSAVYMFLVGIDVEPVSKLPNMRNCIPLLAGLYGLLNSYENVSQYIKKFVIGLNASPSDLPVENLFQFNDKEIFLSIYHEYRGEVSADVIRRVWNYAFLHISYHHTFSQFIFFLKSKTVDLDLLNIEFDMVDGQMKESEIQKLVSSNSIDKLELRFSGTSLSVWSVSLLSECISNRCNVVSLSIHDGNLSDDHIECLQSCIPHLYSLDLSCDFEMTPTSMQYLSKSIKQDFVKYGLSKLILSNLTDEHINSLRSCIPCLSTLHLCACSEMTVYSMKYISDSIIQAVEENKSNLEDLNLTNCELTDNHIKSLQSCIPYLKELDLSENDAMSPVSMKYISDAITEAVKKNTNKLKGIDFSYCGLSDDHIKNLCSCLPNFERVYLSGNKKISTISLKYISNSVMEAARKNANHLSRLNMSSCGLNADGCESLKCYIPDITF